MEYLITESQYKLIAEVSKSKDFNEYSPSYEYAKLGILPKRGKEDEINTIFFNGPEFNKSEYTPSNFPGGYITFTGPNGDFEFPISAVHKSPKSASPYIFGYSLGDSDYNKLKSLLKKSEDKITPVSNDFTADEINQSLKIAFSDYWEPENEDYTPGIKGIHTIGEKNDSDIDWSIMNYFDTKKEVKGLIKEKWEKEGSGDKIEWLSSVFQNDKEFLNKLLTIQWNSIKDGVKREDDALNNLIKMLEGVEFKYESYPPGHKKDRYGSTDISITIENRKPITFQVKPLNKGQSLENGSILVSTYNMANYYKTKKGLDYIMYNNGKNFLIFKNENYYVVDSSNGREVIHYGKPLKTII
jgi:hypothetical protein